MRARERMGLLASLRQSYGDIIRHTFKNNHIQGALAWWAAQSGPPPHEKSSAEFFGWQSMLHEIGAYRPRGGSGMLTQALARCIRDHGGIIMPSTEVAKIIVRESRVQGVETARGNSIYAPAIVASAHIKIVFEELLREWTPPRVQKRIAGLNIGNGFGMVLRCATDRLPRYHRDSAINNRLTTAIQLLCPSLHYLEESYNDFANGIPSKNPAVLAMTFSSVDCTLAPKGKHLLFIWGQYYPYRLRSPLCWKDIAQQEADKLIDVVERAAPGTRDSIRDCYIQSPPEISQLHSMPCANIMHIEMTMKSMLTRRPHRTLRNYHTPLRGLFLANAGMHPGGGISGAAGYNCHIDLLRFLEGRRVYHTERFIAAQND